MSEGPFSVDSGNSPGISMMHPQKSSMSNFSQQNAAQESVPARDFTAYTASQVEKQPPANKSNRKPEHFGNAKVELKKERRRKEARGGETRVKVDPVMEEVDAYNAAGKRKYKHTIN